MPKQPVYRQSALDRLASPEQLDRLVSVSDPRGWLALLVVFLFILLVIAWSLFGSIPTNVQAKGILVSRGGKLSDAMTTAAGVLRAPELKVDQRVERDQILARIEQTALQQQLTHAREVVAEKQADRDRLAREWEQEFELRNDNLARRQEAQRDVIAAAKQRLDYQRRALGLLEEAGKKGFASKQKIQEARTELSQAQLEIANAENDILKLEADQAELSIERQRALSEADRAIAEARRQVRERELQLEQEGVVRAPVTGRITEVKVFDGEVVGKGQAVVSIAHAGEGVQAIAFVPTEHGKKLRAGMSARVELATVKKEEHGTLLGVLASVSEFPISRDGMASILQNDELVNTFAAAGPPYAARIDLESDPRAPSGYRWTSTPGPDTPVTSGTTLRAEISVREQRPIALMVPALKKAIGVY